jgi:predicted nucleic-acid-binding protein
MKSVLLRISLKTEEMEALIDYLLIKEEIKVLEIDMNKSIIKGNEMVTQIKLKTLDLLHIANAVILNATKFVTFDKDFISKKDGIESYKIEIINPL